MAVNINNLLYVHHWCRGSQIHVNTEVNYRTPKTRSILEEDAIRKRHSTPANSMCSRNVPNGAKYGRIEDYEKSEVLGEGSYATVYKGKNLITKMEVALKEIRLNEEEGAPFTAIREASLLRELVHANIVKLFDIIYNKKQLIFVFEYLVSFVPKSFNPNLFTLIWLFKFVDA